MILKLTGVNTNIFKFFECIIYWHHSGTTLIFFTSDFGTTLAPLLNYFTFCSGVNSIKIQLLIYWHHLKITWHHLIFRYELALPGTTGTTGTTKNIPYGIFWRFIDERMS